MGASLSNWFWRNLSGLSRLTHNLLRHFYNHQLRVLVLVCSSSKLTVSLFETAVTPTTLSCATLLARIPTSLIDLFIYITRDVLHSIVTVFSHKLLKLIRIGCLKDVFRNFIHVMLFWHGFFLRARQILLVRRHSKLEQQQQVTVEDTQLHFNDSMRTKDSVKSCWPCLSSNSYPNDNEQYAVEVLASEIHTLKRTIREVRIWHINLPVVAFRVLTSFSVLISITCKLKIANEA